MKWTKVCKQVIEERGPWCEISGLPYHDIHHSIISRLTIRGKRVAELDDKRNATVVNRDYHEHSDKARRDAWKRNCARYGRESMIAWLDSVPLKIKPRVEWLEVGA